MSEKDDQAGSAEVVDFDALNAALGAVPPASAPALPDSEGRSSATYSSAEPHAIPTTRGPQELPNEPAVIVHADETIQTGPPVHMTVPNVSAGMPISSGQQPVMPAASSGGYAQPHSRSHPPEPFVARAAPGGGGGSSQNKYTTPMLDRPRRPGSQTIVVNPVTEPSRQQKFLVFVAMLVIVVAGGLAVLVYLRPNALSFGAHARTPLIQPTAAVPGAPAATGSAVKLRGR